MTAARLNDMTSTTDHVTVGGIDVARRWRIDQLLGSADDDAGPRGSITGTVSIDDAGTPVLHELRIVADPPLTLAEASRLNPAQIMRQAVAMHLWRAAERDALADAGQLAESDSISLLVYDHDFRQAVAERTQAALGRSTRGVKLTDEYLAEVVELYNRRGLHAVLEDTGASERTARRWLSIARQRGLR